MSAPRSHSRRRRAAYAAALLLFVIPALILAEPRTQSPGLVFTVALLLLAACAAFAIARAEGGIHYIAAFFALAAEAVWSRNLTPDRLLPALAIYGIFGLFYIGVPIVARRRGHPLRPQGAGGFLALVSIALLAFLTGGAVAQTALWGVALLLAILNAGLFFEASTDRLPFLSIAGVVLSWIVLALWWVTASVAAAFLPALFVIGGFSILALAGNLWARRRVEPAVATGFDRAIYLGLVGHLFLLFVASQPSLAVPPWPMLGVLLVLDLAIAAASLVLRTGELHLAAAVASALLLALWVGVARVAPWPSVAVLAAGGVAALAFLWIPLARRVRAQIGRFELAAAAGALLAQVVAILAAGQLGAPSLVFLIVAHVLLLTGALLIAARPPWGIIAVIAVAPAALAVITWQSAHPDPFAWRDQLLFAAPLYLVFLLYPEARRARGVVAPHAYIAAVLASAAFFLEARDAMRLGALNGIIGALPLTQALLLAALLVGLKRTKPAANVPLGTIALVAGASLAFVTVAIPLQLEKHWITVGWALEGAALAWLYTRVPHRGLLDRYRRRCSPRCSCVSRSIRRCSPTRRAARSGSGTGISTPTCSPRAPSSSRRAPSRTPMTACIRSSRVSPRCSPRGRRSCSSCCSTSRSPTTSPPAPRSPSTSAPVSARISPTRSDGRSSPSGCSRWGSCARAAGRASPPSCCSR